MRHAHHMHCACTYIYLRREMLPYYSVLSSSLFSLCIFPLKLRDVRLSSEALKLPLGFAHSKHSTPPRSNNVGSVATYGPPRDRSSFIRIQLGFVAALAAKTTSRT